MWEVLPDPSMSEDVLVSVFISVSRVRRDGHGIASRAAQPVAREVTVDPPHMRDAFMREFNQNHSVLSAPGLSVLQALTLTIRVDLAEMAVRRLWVNMSKDTRRDI